MDAFSNLHRDQTIASLEKESFDLLIIGGGITGAGIALDAVSRGMKVALVEQYDFGSGTSSKSTKLIHGGLRYLKQFDFWLVKEFGSERAILHQLAPHLVVPEKMILPIIENGTYGSWLTSIGLKIYDVLANVEGDDKRLMLDRKEAILKEPLLPESILKGAGYYAEYRTDDARLTIEVVKKAVSLGAIAINYCEITQLKYDEGVLIGAEARDQIKDSKISIRAKYAVNATGPWVDLFREKHEGLTHSTKRLQLTKGIHLVVPYKKLPVNQSIYFDVPDGRMIFAIPRGKVTYIGTTDTPFGKNPEQVGVDLVDVLYLVNAVNNMFPNIELNTEDVIASWSGLRPLIYEEGKTAGELSRKDEIFESESGLISIAGGKLTGYRKMAERIVDLLVKRARKDHNLSFKNVQTERLALTENPFENYRQVLEYSNTLFTKYRSFGLDKTTLDGLIHSYGRQADHILNLFEKMADQDLEIRLSKAELQFGLEYEMILKPLDYFGRRSGKLFFEPLLLKKLKDPLLKVFANFFNWDEKTQTKEKEILETAFKKITDFK